MSKAPLNGQHHKLPIGTALPNKLGVVADGRDVIRFSPYGPAHHTIYSARDRYIDEFRELFESLSWEYAGKMNTQLSEIEQEIWSRLVKSHKVFSQALKDFFAEGVDRVSIMQKAFKQGDLATVLYIAPCLNTDELCQLFGELVHISTAPGYAGTAREIIYSLPRDWVLSNIEKVVEPILLDQDVTENEFRRILELYSELDDQLTYKLAQRAAHHSDQSIKEAGEDFLHALSSTQ